MDRVLDGEAVTGPLDDITAYVGNAAFAPRLLAPLLNNLLRTLSNGLPAQLLEIGL